MEICGSLDSAGILNSGSDETVENDVGRWDEVWNKEKIRKIGPAPFPELTE